MIVLRAAALLLFASLLSTLAPAGVVHAGPPKLPNPLDAAAVGQRVRYHLRVREGKRDVERWTLSLRVVEVTAARVRIDSELATVDGAAASSLLLLPRGADWFACWHHATEAAGFHMRGKFEAFVLPTPLAPPGFPDSRWLQVSHRGRYHHGASLISYRAVATYLVCPQLPIRGLLEARVEITLQTKPPRTITSQLTLDLRDLPPMPRAEPAEGD